MRGEDGVDARVVPLAAPRRSAGTTGARGVRRGADAVAAGAARASGERSRRRSTPLIGTASAVAADDLRQSRTAAAPTADGVERPSRARTRSPRQARKRAAAAVPSSAPRPAPSDSASPREPATAVRYLIEAVVDAVVAEGRRAGVDDIEERVASALAFLRRRLTGDYSVDDLGFDPELTEALLPLLRPLYRSWFRVEVRGIDNIPAEGGALIVANHSGTIALDAVMTQLAVHDEHPSHRHLRLLGADLVFSLPVVGELARKTGTTLADNADAERLLTSGELVGVWPEGFKGIGKPFSERYKLQRFGRGGFVSAALEARVPIIPCSIVGAEEIYPIIGNAKTLARLLGLPYLPLTPTFPWLGLLGLVPLPSKWIIEFGTPIDTTTYSPAGAFEGSSVPEADDPMVVFDVTDQVRETIQQTLYALLMQRRSVFF